MLRGGLQPPSRHLRGLQTRFEQHKFDLLSLLCDRSLVVAACVGVARYGSSLFSCACTQSTTRCMGTGWLMLLRYKHQESGSLA